MAYEGWLFLLPLLGMALIAWMVVPILGVIFLALAAFVGYFFRDPERLVPTEPGVLLSPADGKIVSIRSTAQHEGLPSGTLVSIFLSVFDVHINRAPIAGTVADVRYQAGKFLPAFQPDASAHNEQNIVTLQAGDLRVVVTQIAGILARRIVCRAAVGDHLSAGQRFGLIRFGSRVDVLIPPKFTLHVQEGQRVRGGVSIMATCTTQPAGGKPAAVA
jgi:phosphatidylserine decarboxylase